MLAINGSAGSAADAASGLDPRLKPAAHQFEACLMKEFLEPLQHDALFGDGTEGADGNGTLMSFGAEALAQAISERGGFGIANKIIGHFEKSAEGTHTQGSSHESFLRTDPEP